MMDFRDTRARSGELTRRDYRTGNRIRLPDFDQKIIELLKVGDVIFRVKDLHIFPKNVINAQWIKQNIDALYRNCKKFDAQENIFPVRQDKEITTILYTINPQLIHYEPPFKFNYSKDLRRPFIYYNLDYDYDNHYITTENQIIKLQQPITHITIISTQDPRNFTQKFQIYITENNDQWTYIDTFYIPDNNINDNTFDIEKKLAGYNVRRIKIVPMETVGRPVVSFYLHDYNQNSETTINVYNDRYLRFGGINYSRTRNYPKTCQEESYWNKLEKKKRNRKNRKILRGDAQQQSKDFNI
jgi:hypothetical protein